METHCICQLTVILRRQGQPINLLGSGGRTPLCMQGVVQADPAGLHDPWVSAAPAGAHGRLELCLLVAQRGAMRVNHHDRKVLAVEELE